MLHRASMKPLRVSLAMDSPKKSASDSSRTRSWVVAAIMFAAIAAILCYCVSEQSRFINNDKVIAPVQRTSGENDLAVSMEPKGWVDLVIKPLIAEVGGLMLFEAIGMPIVSELLWIFRRLRWMPFIHGVRRLRWLHIGQRIHPLTRFVVRTSSKTSRFVSALPKTVRNLPRSAQKLYKRRSRLAIASEYTNFIGNEEEQ